MVEFFLSYIISEETIPNPPQLESYGLLYSVIAN